MILRIGQRISQRPDRIQNRGRPWPAHARQKRLQSPKALTLVELLVCVAIIACTSAFVLPGLTASARIAQSVEGQARAYLFAVSKTSELRLLSSEKGSIDEFPESDHGYLSKTERAFKWSLVTELFEERPDIREVQLDISWPGRGGEETYRVQSLMRLLEDE